MWTICNGGWKAIVPSHLPNQRFRSLFRSYKDDRFRQPTQLVQLVTKRSFFIFTTLKTIFYVLKSIKI